MIFPRQKGFTLLEIMVALVIFSLLSLMGHQILQGVMRNNEIVRQHADRLGGTVRLFALLEQDLSQALIPSVSTLSGKKEGGFTATTATDMVFHLTRRNWLNPTQAARSSLQEVAWHFVNGRLTRTNLSENRITASFDGILSVRLRFLSNNAWKTQWENTVELPQAIEITLDVIALGEVQRVFLITRNTR